ncbi:Pr6Pr family membrane protein [Hyphomicrobium sp. 1Nfss2.1]|uniref:Pr6Pr family membrane protein n=1 Tax=Hyphomicrobium sp. 1Nfss2.1 TaxID=3413936 RepID=UPI003C7DFCD5
MGKQRAPKSVYRIGAGAITAALVAAQYWLSVVDAADGALLTRSLKFFSFFTILTNLLAAAALLAPAIAPRSALGRLLDRPGVRTAIAGYMIMVGVVYYLLLVGLSDRQGASLFIEHALHAVTPPLFVFDWLLFVDRRSLDWRIGVRGLTYPLIYLAWVLARGATSGWYPYPFLDVADLGYARVLVNAAGLVAIYIALEAVLVAIARALPARSTEN